MVLNGPGTSTYGVEDRFSIPVAMRYIDRTSKLKARLTDDVLMTESRLDGAAI